MRLALASLFLILSPTVWGAQAEDGCPGPDTSTSYEACLLSTETKNLQTQLKQKYEVVFKFATKEGREALSDAQRAWLQYLQKTCSAQQEVFGGIVSINFIRCEKFLTKQRISYFEDLP